MRPLSATEAISPAMERARDVLARPFRLGTFLKIAAVAFFAELGGSFGLNVPSRGGNLHGIAPGLAAMFLAFAFLFGLIFLVIGLILLYIGSRLQLVLVDLVATRQTYISPLWRKFSSTTWRWIALKLLFFFCIVALVAVLVSPVILYFVLHHRGLGGFSFSGLHLSIILLFAAVAFIAVLAITAVYMLLRDFVVPSLALEDVTLSEALRRMRALLAAEPGQVALYLLLKFILLIVFGIGGEILIFIALLLTLIPFGLVGGGLWLALHNAGPAGIAVLIACAIVGGLVFLVWAICLGIAVLGSVYLFGQAYALYFLGGRYPMLGDLLDRSTPPPTYAYAAAFPQYPPTYYPPQPGPPSGSGPGV